RLRQIDDADELLHLLDVGGRYVKPDLKLPPVVPLVRRRNDTGRLDPADADLDTAGRAASALPCRPLRQRFPVIAHVRHDLLEAEIPNQPRYPIVRNDRDAVVLDRADQVPVEPPTVPDRGICLSRRARPGRQKIRAHDESLTIERATSPSRIASLAAANAFVQACSSTR